MSQSSFYGGRPGISFKIVKTFDGIDIPQTADSYVYRKKMYAIRTIDGYNYFIYPFVERTGANYLNYNWAVCELDGRRKNVVYSNNTTGTELVSTALAEGMVQCFKQGSSSTNIVKYEEYVLIDTIKNMCNEDNPENGMVFRRGININFDPDTNPYYGGEYIGTIRGAQGLAGLDGDKGDKGDQGDQGIQGPRGEKGETGGYTILGIYATAGDIPNQPPEVIMGSDDYKSWDVLVGDITNPDEDFHLYVYDYLNSGWVDVGPFLGSSGEGASYAVCYTAGNIAAKTVNVTGFVPNTGTKLIVKFENENTAENPTLNVSNTGAKNLVANGISAEKIIEEGSVFLVVYDGTDYILVGGVGTGNGKDFIGTQAEWNALSAQEKAKYADGIIYITDDTVPTGDESSDGHVILNDLTEMAQRKYLRFFNGNISDNENDDATEITLPDIATTETPGLVMPDGSSIEIDENGVLSAIIPGAEIATENAVGVVKPDNETIAVDEFGTLSANPASGNSLGVIKPDNLTTFVDANGVLSAAGGGGGSDYTISNIVISANGWNSNNQYSLENSYPSNTYDILNLIPNESTTLEQRTAWANAKCGGYYSTNIMKAYGIKPTIDIPLSIYYKQKGV